LLLAVQFPEPSSDLLKQGPAGVVALLQRANQARLTALEVGNGSLERLHSRFPGRDLATGDLREFLGEQGTPPGAEQAPREELQHAAQQHVPADQHAWGMLGLPIDGHPPATLRAAGPGLSGGPDPTPSPSPALSSPRRCREILVKTGWDKAVRPLDSVEGEERQR
jgi:hypothetical protein